MKKTKVEYIPAAREGAYLKQRMHALYPEKHGAVTQFAKDLGVTRQTLYDIFAGKYALTREVAAKLNELETACTIEAAWKVTTKEG
jgi:plasmid maintenance system antidote protein VapI